MAREFLGSSAGILATDYTDNTDSNWSGVTCLIHVFLEQSELQAFA
jgi:hypothetical protein